MSEDSTGEQLPANGEAANETKKENMTDLEKKIIRQIEYYFGDVNLRRDKFLQEQIKADEGWVPLETMIKFNRLKELSEDFTAIVDALAKSQSGLMEISEDKSKIRRSPEKPLPEDSKERKDEINTRTVYAKGFPLDSELGTLMEFCEQYGKTEHVAMRRNKDKTFKGSVFAQFVNIDDAKKFVEAESIKYEDTELKRLWRDDYFKMKNEEKRQFREQKEKEKEENMKKKEKDEEERLLKRITKGAVLHVKGLPENVKLDDIKENFKDYGTLAWVEHSSGDTEAKLRFDGEDSAKSALDKAKEGNDGKVMFKDSELEASILEGDEELAYWKNMFGDNRSRKRKFGGHSDGRRGRGGYRGRGRGSGNFGESRSKKTKFDDSDED